MVERRCTPHTGRRHRRSGLRSRSSTYLHVLSTLATTTTTTTTQCHVLVVGVSGLVVECRTRNFQVTGSNLTAGHLQAKLSKLLTYGVLSSTQRPTLRGTGNEY